MLKKKIRQSLDNNHVQYKTIHWSPTDTTDDFAKRVNLKNTCIAKTTVVCIDNQYAMLVECICDETSLQRWQQLLGCETIRLVDEDELEELFRDYDPNNIPALGNLHDMNVYIDDCFSIGQEIAFNSGSPHELIRMKYDDYAKFVKPILFHIH